MWEVWTDKWGMLTARGVTIGPSVVHLLDSERDGKPFYAQCMIPLHDITLIVPASRPK